MLLVTPHLGNWEIGAPFFIARGISILVLTQPEPNPERGSYFRSDHFSFAKLGVPMFDGGSGEDLIDGGTAKGHAAVLDYIANRYHKPQDEFNPNWDYTGQVQDLQLFYQLGRTYADGAMWPNWRPTAEFYAIRQRSLGR